MALISIVISVATIITSGVMKLALKNSLQMEDFLVLLLVLGAAILFMITSLDSFYIRNLWSFFRETRSGHWQDDSQSENLSSLEIDQGTEKVETGVSSSRLASHPILETYALSSSMSDLESLPPARIISCLFLIAVDLRLFALKICFESHFPWFKPVMLKAAEHSDSVIGEFANKAIRIEHEFDDMYEFSSVFRRRVRSMALELIDGDETESLGKLRALLRSPEREATESLVSVLANPQFRSIRSVVFQCITGDGTYLSPLPLVERMYETDFESARLFREVLEHLTFGKNSTELRATVQNKLAGLKGRDTGSGANNVEMTTQKLFRPFMHTLFLEEYRFASSARRQKF